MKAHKQASIDPFVHATKEPEIVELPPTNVITIEGCGAPEQAGFQAAIVALYGVAYAMKFANTKAGGSDYKVSPLEALWWAGEAKHAFDFQRTPRAAWR